MCLAGGELLNSEIREVHIVGTLPVAMRTICIGEEEQGTGAVFFRIGSTNIFICIAVECAVVHTRISFFLKEIKPDGSVLNAVSATLPVDVHEPHRVRLHDRILPIIPVELHLLPRTDTNRVAKNGK